MPRKTSKTRKQDNPKDSSRWEETFNVKGEDLLGKLKELIREGNVRKVIISDKNGKPIIEIPLTVGVVFTVLVPVFAAVGAMAALVTECSITVVREKK